MLNYPIFSNLLLTFRFTFKIVDDFDNNKRKESKINLKKGQKSRKFD